MLFIVLLFLGPLLCIVSFRWYVFCLWLFWLSCQYLPSDWLERLLRGSLIVLRGSSPESTGQRVFIIILVYCILSLFNCMICSVLSLFNCMICSVLFCSVVPRPYVIYFILLLARYSLFVLKVLLNTKQANKQRNKLHHK